MVVSLVQLVVEKTGALRQLEEACDVQLGIDGRHEVVLDSAVEIAKANGFCGSLELAVGVLRVSGRFLVEKGPAGRWTAIRRSTAMVPVVARPRSTALVPVVAGPRSTALVPVTVGQQIEPDFLDYGVADGLLRVR
jgi:hypothetical protein